jgi:competence protein ComEC
MLLVYLAAAWSAGIVLSLCFPLPQELWGVWLGLPLGSLLIWRNDPLLRRVHLCLAFLLLGALRYTLAQPLFDGNSLASLNERGAVVLIGQVSDPPDVRDRTTNIRVAVTRVQVNGTWRDLSGGALVQVPRETDVRYGDLVRIYGAPTTPPEDTDFSYKDYLARQGIHSLIQFGTLTVQERDQGNWFYTRLYAFRDRALAAIYASLPDPAASLLAGILLGVDSGIPRDVSDAFSTTNTAHIIAISGFNRHIAPI